MSTAKTIAGLAPGLQATALVGYNLGELDFDIKPGKKKNHVKKMVKLGVTNIVAIPFIKTSASMINTIP